MKTSELPAQTAVEADMITRFNVPCVLRDGVTLYANVYAPVTDEPVPVLLLRLPYGKENPASNAFLDFRAAVRAGYMVVVQDVRGRYASEGTFAPGIHEAEDGYDAVEWAARLPGANGTVGMWGSSYAAECQWSAALLQPPSLKSLTPYNSPSHSVYGGKQMRGGAHEFGSRLAWAHERIALADLLRSASAPEQVKAAVDAHGRIQDQFDNREIYSLRPFTKLSPDEPFLIEAVRTFGQAISDPERFVNLTAGRYEQILQPAFIIGGWYDCFLGSTLGQYAGVLEQARIHKAPLPHLVIGPWNHQKNAADSPHVTFGVRATIARPGDDIPIGAQHLRWFDATLKGRPEVLAGIAPVRLFLMGRNTWLHADTFPLAAAMDQDWYLGAGGTLVPHHQDEAAPTTYDYDPSNPVPTLGGANLLTKPFTSGAADQSPLYDRGDVICFTSGELADDVHVVGNLRATLFAASSAVDTDFVVRLCDVHPDGRSTVVADAIVRASARGLDPDATGMDTAEPTLIEPGAIYRYDLDLWATAQTFRKKHRIRVDVTSSSFPRWDPNLNTGKTIATSGDAVIAHQQIFHGGEHPSRITLPVVSADDIEKYEQRP